MTATSQPTAPSSAGPASPTAPAQRSLDDLMALWWRGEVRLPEAEHLRWLEGQRLLPLLGWRAEVKGWALPETIAAAVRRRRMLIAVGQTFVDQQLRALGQTALELGIPVVLVKGAAAGTAYPEPWMRPYSDIDLLTDKEDAERFYQALIARGYAQTAGNQGTRHWHMTPLVPPVRGTSVELHTALAQESGRWVFTIEQWRERLQPLRCYPGLLKPAAVDHAQYIVLHAVIQHGFMMGLQALADIKFLTQTWQTEDWDRLSERAEEAKLTRAVGLLLALVPWFWDEPDNADSQRFAAPSPTLLAATKETIGAMTADQRLPQLWRDAPSYDLRGLLAYSKTILFGDTHYLKDAPMKERIRHYLSRPADLWRSHSDSLWQLVRGSREAKASWRTQRELQTWLRGEEE